MDRQFNHWIADRLLAFFGRITGKDNFWHAWVAIWFSRVVYLAVVVFTTDGWTRGLFFALFVWFTYLVAKQTRIIQRWAQDLDQSSVSDGTLHVPYEVYQAVRDVTFWRLMFLFFFIFEVAVAFVGDFGGIIVDGPFLLAMHWLTNLMPPSKTVWRVAYEKVKDFHVEIKLPELQPIPIPI